MQRTTMRDPKSRWGEDTGRGKGCYEPAHLRDGCIQHVSDKNGLEPDARTTGQMDQPDTRVC